MGESLPGGGSSPAALGHQKTVPQWKNIKAAPVSKSPTQKLGGGTCGKRHASFNGGLILGRMVYSCGDR